jgi:formylglycine-generating enzyme
MRIKSGMVMVLTIFLLLLFFPGALFGENKTALVIGNSSYQHFPVLSQPWREAAAVKASLERLGFEVVYVVDGTYDRMYDALYTFERKLKERGGTAFFHYGGHGLQVGGQNYLLPVDKYIPDERRVKSRAVNATEVVDIMAAAGSTTNIVVLDACRDNPLPAVTRSTDTRGLAKLNAPVNTVVVYSAEAGDTAEDGVFTPTLLEYLETPGLSFTDVLRQTRRAVYEKTGGKQIPGSYDQLFDTIYLAGTAGGTETSRQSGFTVEENYGNIKITTVTEGTLYLNGTRQGTVTARATANLTDLSTGRHSVEMRYTDGEKETKSVTVQKDRTATLAFTYKPAPVSKIPEDFVLVKAGSFTMGSPSGESGRDSDEIQHTVRISKDFYISKYEVTQAEYKSIMGTNPSDTDRGIGDNNPVNKVSWYDAVEYCNKRSRQEGLTPAYTINGNTVTWNKNANGYRLPTEAEWEYAARGGHQAGSYNIYAGSDTMSSVAWYSDNSGGKTHPVGQKQSNELGIYDMSGNVWEWCWDWAGHDPSGSVTDPAGPSSGSNRVVRGGSWYYLATDCRSARRSYYSPSYGLNTLGFRVVRRQ